MKLNVLKAIPGAGKTKAILNDVKNSQNGCVVASISRKLSRDSLNYYHSIGGKDAIIIDGDHCESTVGETIRSNISKRVIFITHQALLEMDLSVFKGRDLYIDEVPDLVSIESYKFKDHFDVIEKYCKIDMTSENMGNVSIRYGMNKHVDQMVGNGLKEDDCISSAIYPIFQSLRQGLPVKLKREEDNNILFFVHDSTVNNWDQLNTITIACANFEDTFTGKILKYWCEWEFVESPLSDKLDFYEYPNSERVKIHVLCNRNWSRTVADKSFNNGTVYTEAVKRVKSYIGNESYLYTTNKARGKLSGRNIQYNPHGLNRYMDETNIVALFSYNPMPWQVPILNKLSEMCGLDKKTLADAFVVSKFIEPVFQLCTRGNIRVPNSDKDIHLFVPDFRTAKYLVEKYIPNGIIDDSLAIDIDEIEAKRPKKARSIPMLLGMNNKQRANWYYHVRTKGYGNDVNNPKHICEAKRWLNEKS